MSTQQVVKQTMLCCKHFAEIKKRLRRFVCFCFYTTISWIRNRYVFHRNGYLQGMCTLSRAPSTTSHLDINVLSILHHLGSSVDYCTLIFDLMRGIYISVMHAYIFLYFICNIAHVKKTMAFENRFLH